MSHDDGPFALHEFISDVPLDERWNTSAADVSERSNRATIEKICSFGEHFGETRIPTELWPIGNLRTALND